MKLTDLGETNPDLYPEIVAAGSLSKALDQAFSEIGSSLDAASTGTFIAYARTAAGSRSCQMFIAAHNRLFIFDFWARGVIYGSGSSSSLKDAAQAIHFWIIEQPNIAQMQSRFSFFTPDPQAIPHEAGQAVEYKWGSLLKTWRVRAKANPDAMSPLPLIEAAMKQPQLAQLFPFTSMNTLHFSRTTGYPFTNDCPFAIPIGNGRFRVYKTSVGVGDEEKRGEVIGEGSAEEVVAMLVANLPPDCGPAVDGTADDFKAEQS
jgi:hypothetical protein